MSQTILDPRVVRHRLSSVFALINTSFEMIYQASGDREEANELHQLGIDEMAALMSELDQLTQSNREAE